MFGFFEKTPKALGVGHGFLERHQQRGDVLQVNVDCSVIVGLLSRDRKRFPGDRDKLSAFRLPLRKWAFAVYLYVTNLKGLSSMKLHRDLEITQKSAWYMLQRLRESWDASGLETFAGPVEVDETYFGGLEKNKPCLSGYHPHPLYVVCLLGLQATAGAGALRRRSG